MSFPANFFLELLYHFKGDKEHYPSDGESNNTRSDNSGNNINATNNNISKKNNRKYGGLNKYLGRRVYSETQMNEILFRLPCSLEELAESLFDPLTGVQRRDRKHKRKTYRNCFTGLLC